MNYRYKYIYISIINQSYWGYLHQLNAIVFGTPYCKDPLFEPRDRGQAPEKIEKTCELASLMVIL